MFKVSTKHTSINTGPEFEPTVYSELKQRIFCLSKKVRLRSAEGRVSRGSITLQVPENKKVDDSEDYPTMFKQPQQSEFKQSLPLKRPMSSNYTTIVARSRPISSQKIQPTKANLRSRLISGLSRLDTENQYESIYSQKELPPKHNTYSQLRKLKGSASKRTYSQKEELYSNTDTVLKEEEPTVKIFKREIESFEGLYERLASILAGLQEGSLLKVEEAIAEYVEYIEAQNVCFIDDLLDGQERTIKQSVRLSRLNESLSVAYLFLEMAQERANTNISDLVNFIGFSLSNVLLTVRLYTMLYKLSINHPFLDSIHATEVSSFGERVTREEDAVLRMQHNNETIKILHRKLGRNNPEFEECIQMFLRKASRENTSCSQCAHYIFEFLALHVHQQELTGLCNVLQTAPRPYCPPPIHPYTLIIEPLSVLTHNRRLRPYVFEFLEWAQRRFDVILWTWQLPFDAETQEACAAFEPFVKWRLYRHHCVDRDQVYVKDLLRLGRDLNRVVLLDYDKRIFERQPKNGVELRWKGNRRDNALLSLSHIFEDMLASVLNFLYSLAPYLTPFKYTLKNFMHFAAHDFFYIFIRRSLLYKKLYFYYEIEKDEAINLSNKHV